MGLQLFHVRWWCHVFVSVGISSSSRLKHRKKKESSIRKHDRASLAANAARQIYLPSSQLVPLQTISISVIAKCSQSDFFQQNYFLIHQTHTTKKQRKKKIQLQRFCEMTTKAFSLTTDQLFTFKSERKNVHWKRASDFFCFLEPVAPASQLWTSASSVWGCGLEILTALFPSPGSPKDYLVIGIWDLQLSWGIFMFSKVEAFVPS